MTDIWLFGEASVNINKKPSLEFERLFKVSEACGYMVEWHQKTENRNAFIEVLGEGAPDDKELISELSFDENADKFLTIQKVLYKVSWNEKEQKQNKKMLKVFNYLGGEFVEIFDLEKHEIDLKLDVNYQKALAREGKKDDPLYTGNGVEKRSCTCSSGDECPYFACANCKSQKIEFSNYSHACKNCNRLQDVHLLEPFIICEKHGKFSRDQGECPKCLGSW